MERQKQELSNLAWPHRNLTYDNYTTYAVAASLWFFACGSMVLSHFPFFALRARRARKAKNDKEKKYRSAEG
jgi:hypothetical protein